MSAIDPDALRRITIFAGLSDDALACLVRKAEKLECQAGEVLVREGESGNRFFLVLAGEVQVLKRCKEGGETELARLGPGEFFGEMCVLETLPRVATVQTTVASTVLRLSALAFLELYESQPAQHSLLALNLARDLSRRLRRLDEVFAARH